MDRFGRFLLLSILFLTAAAHGQRPPNIVIIFADDLGYGDLGCYGHPTISTPHLDRMAAEGQRWTSFYSAASVCTPSRAALMTGRHPMRSGTMAARLRVFGERSLRGLPPSEITIAEILQPRGYATAMIGKWHLGHLPDYLPTKQGFDTYFGLVSSNDHNKTYSSGSIDWKYAAVHPKIEFWDIPLMRNDTVIEKPADQHTVTKRYTEEAVRFIREHKEGPFFIYLAHTMPHTPLFRSKAFEDKSLRGVYGDVIEEIDWSVGRVLDTLREEGLGENTLVLFTSDNGPWLIFDQHGGSAGLLREGKGSTWEGGMREPAIFWWPGEIQSGVVRQMGSTLDVLPTVARLAGAAVPSNRPIDGYDLSGVLVGKSKSPRKEIYFYREERLFAVRRGAFKAHFWTQTGYTEPRPTRHDPPLLFHLEHDPGERYDVAAEHPAVLEQLMLVVKEHNENFKPGENQVVHRADGPVGVFRHPPVTLP